MDMVTVARYTNLLEAHIARGRLESEGIAAFIADENIIWANWLLADAIGGVQLRVPLEDSVRARRILSEVDGTDVLENDLENTSSGSNRCPGCGAPAFRDPALLSRLVFLSIALVSFPLPFTPPLKHSDECGYSRLDLGGSPYSPLTLFAGILINTLLLVGVFFLLYGIVKGMENYF